jgi:hypothetical protein
LRESLPYLGRHILQVYQSLGRYFNCESLVIGGPLYHACPYYDREGFTWNEHNELAIKLNGGRTRRR